VVATAHTADETAVAEAVATMARGRHGWGARDQEDRSGILRVAAECLRQRRHHALALLVRETGKTWAEADAEYCEAVDFLKYYASAALDLVSRSELRQGSGERNRLIHMPRGIAGVIIPWNFPIAIGLGMTVGPLVMGNAAVIKPAEQTPAAGAFIYQLLLDAGVPAEVIALLPGAGETGAALVAGRQVDTILFTGSRQVGLGIIEAAGHTVADQLQVKKVVAEMGGKNCIVVDESADLDVCIEPILRSAFAFGGQNVRQPPGSSRTALLPSSSVTGWRRLQNASASATARTSKLMSPH
jgi:RHH-type proline utilization regulon transcriptional repressor/proline dehydrogenase/delta 1-pyrroline-5-carboxylate dehydrogenase